MVVLSVLLWILVVLLGLLLLLVLLALLLPVEARAAGRVFLEHDVDLHGRVDLRFGGRLFALRVETGEDVAGAIFGWRITPGASSDEKTAARREKRRARKQARTETKSAKRKRGIRDFWRARGAFAGVLGRLARALHLGGEVEGSLGFDDPTDTVRVVGLLNALAASQRRLWVAVEPDWSGERVDLRGALQTRFRLGALVWVAIRALFERDIRRALRGRPVRMRKTRRTA